MSSHDEVDIGNVVDEQVVNAQVGQIAIVAATPTLTPQPPGIEPAPMHSVTASMAEEVPLWTEGPEQSPGGAQPVGAPGPSSSQEPRDTEDSEW